VRIFIGNVVCSGIFVASVDCELMVLVLVAIDYAVAVAVAVAVVVILIKKSPTTAPGMQATAPLAVSQTGIARTGEAKSLSAALLFALFHSVRWDVVIALVSVLVLVMVSAQRLESRERH